MRKEKCQKCGRPVPARRNEQFCYWCMREMTIPKVTGKANDSISHRNLKAKAVTYLLALGCHTVRQEVHREFVYDVMGWADNNTYVIECGGSKKSKLDAVLQRGYLLFVWPYGAEQPTKYNSSMSICHCCGAINAR